MKRLLRRLLLIVLVLVELWLLTAFLPNSWQERIYTPLNRVSSSRSYDYSRITHPALVQELQPFKPLALAWLGLLAVVNGGAVVVLWNWQTRKLM